uniref:Uncharacterized protein n=1 Tax=Sphaerodactylus townsendi TaxID=933632 RepID=A0ACB8FL63_9SAUR
MCLTDRGSELTRISVVPAYCIMDELVKPSVPAGNTSQGSLASPTKLLRSVTTNLARKHPDFGLANALPPMRFSRAKARTTPAKPHLDKANQREPKVGEDPVQYFLDILQSHGQTTLLLGGQTDAFPDNSQHKRILQQALEEMPKSSFSVVQFPSDRLPLTSHLAADLRANLRTKLAGLLTVYAGPFGKGWCVEALKKTFENYGHIRSIRVVTETLKPHLCIQYEVLEAAQLAIENLDGAEVAGSRIKVQRPVTEMTLDCEAVLRQLETDVDNEGAIYVAGLEETHSEADLREQLGFVGDPKSVFWPRDPQSGRRRNYCFLRFPTVESASAALKIIQKQAARGGTLYSRGVLTPPHLHQWICQETQNSGWPTVPQLPYEVGHQPKEQLLALEQDLKSAMRAHDRRIKKLYGALPERALCIILLPGTDRVPVSLPGFGLLAVKDDSGPA